MAGWWTKFAIAMAIGILVAQCACAQAPAGKEIRQDFRNRQPLSDLFELRGPDADAVAKPEVEGLRITLPADRAAHFPVTVGGNFRLAGDFEITADFELLSANQPTDGYGCGVSLSVADSDFNDPRQKFAKIARVNRANEGSVFMAETWRKGVPNSWHGPTVPSEARVGQLRLARKGARLIHLASEGPGKEFVTVFIHEQFGGEELARLWLEVVDSGKPGNAVDARLIQLRILTGEKTPAQANAAAPLPAPAMAPANPPPAQGPTPPGRISPWLVIGLLVGLALTMTLGLALLAWIALRKRNSALPATMAFPCPQCERNLKTPADLAGKRVKCKECGAIVQVPA